MTLQIMSKFLMSMDVLEIDFIDKLKVQCKNIRP